MARSKPQDIALSNFYINESYSRRMADDKSGAPSSSSTLARNDMPQASQRSQPTASVRPDTRPPPLLCNRDRYWEDDGRCRWVVNRDFLVPPGMVGIDISDFARGLLISGTARTWRQHSNQESFMETSAVYKKTFLKFSLSAWLATK
ncbi:hypothetical protein KXV68_006768 [Aspergillus fumigatus]|uniref:Uncharacterized protein n=1 Tax=Aspergillus fumigatus (strain CBS 144.89 / FGSC A1163 / CEA10) TaxID=451804 RepID=B0YB57_ASPFC|nr:hypothetical protein AFUB_091640 [Aspergillus fumigatus A1163]KAH1501730.1 hypothetical protein KXX06_001140 [Aspergillus fumigatus]KAH1585979.1 hypothetical protein KXX44_000741 [Aspergillus fumigatus]KAH1796700.1 hypothetical protein KXX20_004271 [Aspergillus fumigatus]KAH2142400.1 hypothetical protein KXV68_006768 [Aspergillus fumigatus]